MLLTLRSPAVHQGGTWSIAGGAIDEGESAHDAACREVFEELGIEVRQLPTVGQHEFECGGWTYTTVLLAAPGDFELDARGWETDEVRWFDLDEVDALAPRHPSFAASWPAVRELVIDAGAGNPGESPSRLRE